MTLNQEFARFQVSLLQSAQIALSSLIYAMEEIGKVALVRRVYNTNSRVTIGCLAPRIKLNYEV